VAGIAPGNRTIIDVAMHFALWWDTAPGVMREPTCQLSAVSSKPWVGLGQVNSLLIADGW